VIVYEGYFVDFLLLQIASVEDFLLESCFCLHSLVQHHRRNDLNTHECTLKASNFSCLLHKSRLFLRTVPLVVYAKSLYVRVFLFFHWNCGIQTQNNNLFPLLHVNSIRPEVDIPSRKNDNSYLQLLTKIRNYESNSSYNPSALRLYYGRSNVFTRAYCIWEVFSDWCSNPFKMNDFRRIF